VTALPSKNELGRLLTWFASSPISFFPMHQLFNWKDPAIPPHTPLRKNELPTTIAASFQATALP
jgi:hypothetical protein